MPDTNSTQVERNRQAAAASKAQEAADEKSAEKYEKLWKKTFQNVTDAALDAISQRNVSFGTELSKIAQQSLKNFTKLYISENIIGDTKDLTDLTDAALNAISQRNVNFGNALSKIAQQSLKDSIREHLLGGGGAASGVGKFLSGGSTALGVSSALFPTETGILFQEIGKTISGSWIGNFLRENTLSLFHSPVSDLYAQAKGQQVARSFEGNSPDALRNARDFADNFSDGFLRGANVGGNDAINITINVADLINNSDDGIVRLSARISELQAQGQLPASKG